MTDLTFVVGMSLTIIGIILAFLAMVMMLLPGEAGAPREAGILLIGPLPIIFGTDRQSVKLLVILAIVLMLIVSALTILPYLVR